MTKSKGWDSEENAVQSNWMKFNVPLEDKIHGTLIAKRTMKSTMPDKAGELVHIYEIKADEESVFHALDDKKVLIPEPRPIRVGDIFSIGGTAVIDRQMQNIKVGQIIGLKYIEEKAAKQKGFNPAKIVKVYAPKNDDGSPLMDEAFLEQQTVEQF